MSVKKQKEFLANNDIGGFEDINSVVKEYLINRFIDFEGILEIKLPEDFVKAYIEKNKVEFEYYTLAVTSSLIKKLSSESFMCKQDISEFIKEDITRDGCTPFIKIDMMEMYNENRDERKFTNGDIHRSSLSMNIKDSRLFEEFLVKNNINYKKYNSFEEFLVNETEYLDNKSDDIKNKVLNGEFKKNLIKMLKVRLNIDVMDDNQFRKLDERVYISITGNSEQVIKARTFLFASFIVSSRECVAYSASRLQFVHQYIPCLLRSILVDKSKASRVRDKVFSLFWGDDIAYAIDLIK